MRQATRLALVAILLLGCVGCDQVSKHFARMHLNTRPATSLFGDTVRFTYAENSGAFLSLGSSLPEQARVLLFQGFASLLVLGLLWAAAFARTFGREQIVAAALIAASGLGNLIDRLFRDGLVTDFLNVGIGDLRTGIFNVADVAGVVGVAIFVFAKSDNRPAAS